MLCLVPQLVARPNVHASLLCAFARLHSRSRRTHQQTGEGMDERHGRTILDDTSETQAPWAFSHLRLLARWWPASDSSASQFPRRVNRRARPRASATLASAEPRPPACVDIHHHCLPPTHLAALGDNRVNGSAPKWTVELTFADMERVWLRQGRVVPHAAWPVVRRSRCRAQAGARVQRLRCAAGEGRIFHFGRR